MQPRAKARQRAALGTTITKKEAPKGRHKTIDPMRAKILFRPVGALLATLPLIAAVLLQRANSATDWTTLRMINELGMLAMALLLVGTGTLLKLRAPTICGGFTMVVYLVSLLFFVRLPEKLQTVAVYMMLGGGAFFVTALLLSIYRDYVLALPEYIKRRNGIFSVLNWK